jgi:hypothetical protein
MLTIRPEPDSRLGAFAQLAAESGCPINPPRQRARSYVPALIPWFGTAELPGLELSGFARALLSATGRLGRAVGKKMVKPR